MTNINDSKLIKLLKSFSTLEMNRFKKMLDAPFFNSNDKISRFFSILKKEHPDFNNVRLTKEKIHKKIYGAKEEYDNMKMNSLFHELYRLTEDFLIYSNTINNKKNRQQSLATILLERDDSLAQEVIKNNIERITSKAKTEYPTSIDYLHLQQSYHKLWTNFNIKNINEEDHFLEAHKNLDNFYLHTKLQYIAEFENRRNIYTGEDYGSLWKYIKELYKEPNIGDNPIFEILVKIIQLHSGELSIEHFNDIKKHIEKHLAKLNRDIQRDLILHLIGYSIQQANKGNAPFLKETFTCYKVLIERNLHLVKKSIRDAEYINIALLGLKLNNHEWVEDFCNTHEQFLTSDRKEDTINYVKAIQAFLKKDLIKANHYINQVKSNNKLIQYPRIKAQIIRELYEEWFRGEDNGETLINQANAYERLIRRNKNFASDKSKIYFDFIKIVKELLKLRMAIDVPNRKLDELVKKVSNSETIAYKDWLMHKIDQLKKEKGHLSL